MSKQPLTKEEEDETREDDEDYLTDLPDGAGCVEIWERMSEERDTSD